MKFTIEQLRRAILREKRLAEEYRKSFRPGLAKFYEKQAQEREAELIRLESGAA